MAGASSASVPGPAVKRTRENWLQEHPVYKEMLSYGFGRDQTDAAFSVYLDLEQRKRWALVQPLPCPHLQLVYLAAAQTRAPDSRRQAIVPATSDRQFSHSQLQDLLRTTLCREEGEEGAGPVDGSLVLAVCDYDSTIVYYTLTQGLKPPTKPRTEDSTEPRTEDSTRNHELWSDQEDL